MSIFYMLDARFKLIFILLFTLLVFFIDKIYLAVFLLILSAVIRISAKIPFAGFKLIINLTLLAAIIILIQMIFAPGDTYIIKSLLPGGIGSLKMEGLILGILLSIRLTALVIILPVFTETTPAHKISAAFCALGFNYRTAFIITSAFNMIPVFKNEALIIMDAQKLRGMQSFEKGGVLSKIKAYTGLLLPLMLNAMRKAQVSSAAMDARAFGIYKTRTWIDKPKAEKKDFIFLAVLIITFTFIVYLNYK